MIQGSFNLYLRWIEHHLSAYFGTLMTLLKSQWFLFLAVFLCDTPLAVFLCDRTCYKNMSNYDSDNAENLRQNKGRFSLIAEHILLIILH